MGMVPTCDVMSCFYCISDWCPCMAINVCLQFNGGLLPDIILLAQCYLHRGTRSNAMMKFSVIIAAFDPTY